MGATASHSSPDHPPSRALHVLRVIPGSPASLAGIQVFFDFIVGIEGNTTESAIDAQSLEHIVESHEGRPLNLIVWSSKHRSSRLVSIVPSRQWALDSITPSSPLDSSAKPSLLGLSMRVCEPELALDHVWHILEILEGSPAESAGLVPFGDWIVGWSGGVLAKEGDFYELIEQHVEKPLRVYVYSYDFDTLREVVLVPNRMWGGAGLLGCGVGYGLLHRIPQIQPNSDPHGAAEAPAETTLNDDDDGGPQELFVPADEYPEYDASAALNGRLVVHHPQDSDHDDRSPYPQPHNLDYEHDDYHNHGHDQSLSYERRSGAPSPSPEPLISNFGAPSSSASTIVTSSVPITAPIPQKIPPPVSRLDSSGSGTPSPPSRSAAYSEAALAEYRRRSQTPDTLKRSMSPRVEDLGIRRLGSPIGSPRLFGFGHHAAGIGLGAAAPTERRNSGLNPSPSTPKTEMRLPSASADNETEDGSEGDTMGASSITSVD